MTAISQIVSYEATPFYHNLCVEDFPTFAQSVIMEADDKNGGPNHLKAWREFVGLTQADLAAAVGTNANMIGYLESGERGLSAKWLRRLAPALKTTSGMLLEHDPRDLDSDIWEIWANADNRTKRQISEVAKALIAAGGKQ